MGVPGFFAWLLKEIKLKHYKIDPIYSKESPSDNIDTLYIDANCLFHPQCYKILYHYTKITDVNNLENKMIKRILDYITFLINYVNPKNVFIAVDGPAPMAKLNQQRKRRFKSVQDNETIDKIKKYHGKNLITIWNNTCITPGTIFMEKLHQQLISYCKNLKINCVYSSYHTPGEGEHKILQEIKINRNNDCNVIYGLDADLIFLSLASGRNNIYLLRESTELKKRDDPIEKSIDDVSEDLDYVSIDNLKLCINMIINNAKDVNDMDNTLNNDYVNDFIIVCYFLGNDFIPNIPSIDIKNGGMEFLIKKYVSIQSTLDVYLYENEKINELFLCKFICEIGKFEKYYFETKYMTYKDKLDIQKCQSTNDYDIDIWNFENIKNVSLNDKIKLGVGEYASWKNRYYENYYNVTTYTDKKMLINKMCVNYIEGIYWITSYYFQSCVSNVWQYNYYHSPFATDIGNYLNVNKHIMVTYKPDIILKPIVQLLAVISPQCKNLLPLPFQQLMGYGSNIIDLFPQHVDVDMLYKHVQHKCIPMVPNIDIKRIMDECDGIKLNGLENERNKICDNFVFNKK